MFYSRRNYLVDISLGKIKTFPFAMTGTRKELHYWLENIVAKNLSFVTYKDLKGFVSDDGEAVVIIKKDLNAFTSSSSKIPNSGPDSTSID